MFGPLDWQRDDLRDARQAWIHGGKEGTTVEDCQLYPAPTVETEADRAIKRIESILADNESRGDAEHAENCRREIRRIQRESALENATGSR